MAGVTDDARPFAAEAVIPLTFGIRGISECARQVPQVRDPFVDALQDVLVALFFRLT